MPAYIVHAGEGVRPVKITDAEISALGDLMSHDPDLLVGTSKDPGLITEGAYRSLLALWNRAQAAATELERVAPRLIEQLRKPCPVEGHVRDCDCRFESGAWIVDPGCAAIASRRAPR